MPKYAAEMEKVFEAVFSGSSIDPKTGKLVEADAGSYAEADKILKGVLESMAKEKWLVKESDTDSLAHMAGMIKFQELNAGPSSVKSSKAPVKPVQAPAGGMTESVKTSKSSLGFSKIFEELSEFSGDQESGVGDGQDVIDGDQEFTDAQTGAGDAGQMAGSDEDMTMDGDTDPAVMGAEDGQADMGDLGGDVGIDGDGTAGELDFDLDSFLDGDDGLDGDEGFGDPGQQGQQGVDGMSDDMGDIGDMGAVDDGALNVPSDEDDLVTGKQSGGLV